MRISTLIFYTNKSYLGRRLEVEEQIFFVENYGIYCPFCVFVHAEFSLQNWLRMHVGAYSVLQILGLMSYAEHELKI